jgi:hypothetical protein
LIFLDFTWIDSIIGHGSVLLSDTSDRLNGMPPLHKERHVSYSTSCASKSSPFVFTAQERSRTQTGNLSFLKSNPIPYSF